MSFYNNQDLMEDIYISGPNLKFEEDTAKLITKCGIEVADRFDDEIYEQIIKIAKEKGLTSVFVLNKHRIAEVLRKGLEAEKNKEIKALKAELDRLTAIEEAHREQNGELRKEVEALQVANEHLAVFLEEAKAEAIKEFAESAEKRICEKVNAPTPTESYIVEKCIEVIYQIAKEMGVEL